MIKTTMVLPKELWKGAKIRAVQEESDLNRIVIAALEAYLKTKGPAEEKKS